MPLFKSWKIKCESHNNTVRPAPRSCLTSTPQKPLTTYNKRFFSPTVKLTPGYSKRQQRISLTMEHQKSVESSFNEELATPLNAATSSHEKEIHDENNIEVFL